MKTSNALKVVALAAALVVSGQTKSGAQTWTNKANLLKQGRSMGVALLNGKIYAVGGYCGSHCDLATADEYDPATDTWTSKANMQSVRYAPAAAAVNGKLYAIGGYASAGGPSVISASIEEYDPVGNTWTNKASMNTPRYAHQAVALNGKIYAIGGQTTGDVPLSSVEEYDSVSNTWSLKADMPSPRVSFGAVAVGGKIYVVGGRMNNDLVAPTYAFDPSSNLWTTNANIPTTRATLSAALINGRIRVMGGTTQGGPVATVEEFDPALDTWNSLPDLPSARNECFANLVGDTLYVFGGYNDYSMQALVLQPVLSAFTAIELEFQTTTGRVYQIQASPDLTTWTNFGTTISGDGNLWNKTFSTRGSGKLFYRVEFAP